MGMSLAVAMFGQIGFDPGYATFGLKRSVGLVNVLSLFLEMRYNDKADLRS